MGGERGTAAIAVDTAGNAYLTGSTDAPDFPTVNAYQPKKHPLCGAYCYNPPCRAGCYTAFIAKLNSTGTALLYSTYLGGSGDEEVSGLAIDAAGNAYISGTSWSDDFPVTSGG